MAAKGKTSKKKGPKGKRARAKAKLERQWGEESDGPVAFRSSRSRLLPPRSKSRRASDDADEELGTLPAGDETSAVDSIDQDEDMSQSEEQSGHDDPCSSLLAQIRNKTTGAVWSANECAADWNNRTDRTGKFDDDESGDEEVSDVTLRNDNGALLDHLDDLFKKRFIECDSTYRQAVATGTVPRADDSNTSTGWKKLRLSDAWDMQVSTPTVLSRLLPNQHKALANLVSSGQDEELGSAAGLVQLLDGSTLRQVAAATFNSICLYADALVVDDLQPLLRSQVEAVVIQHILAHIYRYRSAVAEAEEFMSKAKRDDDDDADVDGVGTRRDQGFLRPSVLVLLPTRHCCYQFLEQLTKRAKKAEVWNRFQDEYGPTPVAAETTTDHRRRVLDQKSADWKELFADEHNSDDDFKIGVQWNTKKNRFRMYTDFLKSDIIVASPLGLKMLPDHDCLSSIEICVVARADVLAQQNWDHVNDILDKLNQQPKSTNETDFSRVREYYLEGKAKEWRQTIFSTAFLSPPILSSFRQHSASPDGQVKIRKRYPEPKATDSTVYRQVFTRVPCKTFAEAGSTMVQHFFDKIFEKLEEQTMVFISSYFDFVSVRNTLIRKEFDDFVSITEYSRPEEVTRGRARFRQKQRKLLLYTGRAHFFMRHAIKGVQHVVFLGVPDYPSFYTDHVDRLESDEASTSTCQLLFTKYDGLSLERIVGSDHCARMIKGEKSTYVLTAGS